MNEKEARDIFTEYGGSKIAYVTCYEDNSRFQYVKGYLERVEQEKEIFGPIVKALETIWKNPHLGLLYRDESNIPGIFKTFYKDNPSWK